MTVGERANDANYMAYNRAMRVSRSRVRSVNTAHWVLRTAIRLQKEDRLVEQDLVDQLRFTRGTIREALHMLAREGLIERERRVGTAVIRDINTIGITSGLLETGSWHDEDFTMQKLFTAQLVPDAFPMFDESIVGDHVHMGEWLVRRQGEPHVILACYSTKEVRPAESCDWIVAGNGDLERLRDEYNESFVSSHGSGIARIDITMEALLPDSRTARLLGIEEDQPVLRCTRTKFTADGHCREFSTCTYPGYSVALTSQVDVDLE